MKKLILVLLLTIGCDINYRVDLARFKEPMLMSVEVYDYNGKTNCSYKFEDKGTIDVYQYLILPCVGQTVPLGKVKILVVKDE